jgi:hypothetical protein
LVEEIGLELLAGQPPAAATASAPRDLLLSGIAPPNDPTSPATAPGDYPGSSSSPRNHAAPCSSSPGGECFAFTQALHEEQKNREEDDRFHTTMRANNNAHNNLR